MYVFLKRTYTVHYTLYILFHLRGRVGCKWGLSMSLSIRGGRGPNRHMINYKIFLSECYQTRVNFYRSRSGWAVTIFPKFSHAFLNKSISPIPCTWWLVVPVAITCSNFQPHKNFYWNRKQFSCLGWFQSLILFWNTMKFSGNITVVYSKYSMECHSTLLILVSLSASQGFFSDLVWSQRVSLKL